MIQVNGCHSLSKQQILVDPSAQDTRFADAAISVMGEEADVFQSRYSLLTILYFANLTLTRQLGMVDGRCLHVQGLHESRLNSGLHSFKVQYPIFSSSMAI